MKVASLLNTRIFGLMILAFCLTTMLVSIPSGGVFADANQPTIEPSPVPTETPIPDTPTQASPSETPYPYPSNGNEGLAGAVETPVSKPEGGLSTINRILLVSLAIVTVLVIGVIVYLLYNQTRGGSLEDRY